MESTSKINEKQNENILVYPPIKTVLEYSESKKYLSFFTKRISNKRTSEKSYEAEQ